MPEFQQRPQQIAVYYDSHKIAFDPFTEAEVGHNPETAKPTLHRIYEIMQDRIKAVITNTLRKYNAEYDDYEITERDQSLNTVRYLLTRKEGR